MLPYATGWPRDARGGRDVSCTFDTTGHVGVVSGEFNATAVPSYGPARGLRSNTPSPNSDEVRHGERSRAQSPSRLRPGLRIPIARRTSQPADDLPRPAVD